MGASAFSATIQKVIIERVRASILSVWSSGEKVLITENNKDKVNPDSVFSTTYLRKVSDSGESGHESILTKRGLQLLAEQFLLLSENVELSKAANMLLSNPKLFDNFVAYINSSGKSSRKYSSNNYNYRKVSITGKGFAKIGSVKEANDVEDDFISIHNMELGTLNKLFIEFLKENGAEPSLVEYIKKETQAGHLSGVLTRRFQNIFGLNVTSSSAENYRDLKVGGSGGGEDVESFNNIMTQILKLLADADYLSSNVVRDIKIFSRSNKNLHKRSGGFSTSSEMQLELLNKGSGSKLIGIGQNLSNLVISLGAKPGVGSISKSAATIQLNNLVKNLKKVADDVIKTGESYSKENLSSEVRKTVENIMGDAHTIQKLLTTEGSDTTLDSIENTIISILKTGKIPAAQNTSISSKERLTLKKPLKVKVNTPIIKTKKVAQPIFKNIKGQYTSLTSLQNLINSKLAEQIKRNMGKGFSKSVLNNRTGRFASSAQVERLTMSKQGMITAFYSYMKSPYQTFEPGFAQGSPQSRDPKLLIGRSIREIASTSMANRLRAVRI